MTAVYDNIGRVGVLKLFYYTFVEQSCETFALQNKWKTTLIVWWISVRRVEIINELVKSLLYKGEKLAAHLKVKNKYCYKCSNFLFLTLTFNNLFLYRGWKQISKRDIWKKRSYQHNLNQWRNQRIKTYLLPVSKIEKCQ